MRYVAHMHRPPPQKESTLTNNMVEHPRHVAEQYRAIPTIASLPFRTLYLGGPGQPEVTGGCKATGKEDSEGEQKKNKDVMSIKGGGDRWRTPIQCEIHIADDELESRKVPNTHLGYDEKVDTVVGGGAWRAGHPQSIHRLMDTDPRERACTAFGGREEGRRGMRS